MEMEKIEDHRENLVLEHTHTNTFTADVIIGNGATDYNIIKFTSSKEELILIHHVSDGLEAVKCIYPDGIELLEPPIEILDMYYFLFFRKIIIHKYTDEHVCAMLYRKRIGTFSFMRGEWMLIRKNNFRSLTDREKFILDRILQKYL